MKEARDKTISNWKLNEMILKVFLRLEDSENLFIDSENTISHCMKSRATERILGETIGLW